MIEVNDRVVKVKGYPFYGVIVSKFYTTNGNLRYVVEATGSGYQGMLHIFNEHQIQLEK